MENDREKILRGLVEHDGRWIPIAEKLVIVREGGMAKVSVSLETAAQSASQPQAVPVPPAAPVPPSSPPVPPPAAVQTGTVADPTLDKAPLSSVEKAAFSKFADAMSKDDPRNWHLPGSRINIEEVKRDFKEPEPKTEAGSMISTGVIARALSQAPAPGEPTEDTYLEYLRAQRRRTLYIFVGVAVGVIVAGAAVVLVVLNG